MELTCIAAFYYNPVRYRGLKNFRSTEWDPHEGLPDDYSRIFEFENFGRTRQRVLKEASSAAAPACASGRSSRHSSTGLADTSAMDIEPLAEALHGESSVYTSRAWPVATSVSSFSLVVHW